MDLDFLSSPLPTDSFHQISNSATAITNGSRKDTALLCTSPSSALIRRSSMLHSFSGPRLGTLTRSRPASGPRCFSAVNPMHAEALFMPFRISLIFQVPTLYNAFPLLSLLTRPLLCVFFILNSKIRKRGPTAFVHFPQPEKETD